ncbi:NfeD family protein [Leptolyngbya sp. NK1-12]|uniref:NfeD family protein n=1 Tax=Leptolyngbya sp. NK1-12 TaxID=2547451 RepID=A0AA96WE99_9CYAN|nr:NfeD family protein [Leptolyngbya sp. NK1-12]WNZ23723.1 NfeD family protein [Leptolyngbya sp. NK1-12]
MPSAPILWLTAGLILCLMELVLPTAFVELTMGVSALIVGVIAWFVPSLTVQVVLWLLLSIFLTVLLRRLLPKRSRTIIEDAKEAKTLTEIAPGETGRVLYEGNSWQARCEDDRMTIAPDQRVYVVGRRGTTLIVIPESLVQL